MDLLQVIPIAAQVSLFVSVFGFGLRAGPNDVLYLLRRPRLLGLSLLSMFVVMPTFALVLVLVFERSPAIAIAVSTLALSPVPPLLPRTEDQANADTSYGFGLMVTVALLSIVIVPALVGFLGRLMGLQFVYPAQTIIVEMLRVVVLPVILGLLVNHFAPELAGKLKEPITRITRLLLGVVAILLLVAIVPAIRQSVSLESLLAFAVFTIGGLVIGEIMSGPDPRPDHAVVLSLSTASRHPAVAIALAAANFPTLNVGSTILIYSLLNGVICALYVRWRLGRSTAVSGER